MCIKNKRGFTLVEVAVVLGVILIVLGIQLPSLVQSKMQARETAAVGALRAIHTAQQIHYEKTGAISGSVEELVDAERLDATLKDEQRDGHVFFVRRKMKNNRKEVQGSTQWAAYCWPTDYGATGRYVYLITPDGQILRWAHEFRNDRQAANWSARHKYFKTFQIGDLSGWQAIDGKQIKK